MKSINIILLILALLILLYLFKKMKEEPAATLPSVEEHSRWLNWIGM